jgi:hypothetical protein
MEFSGLILVEDGSGARHRIGAFWSRRFFKMVRQYRLETGARVDRIDSDTFQVPATGEKLQVLR